MHVICIADICEAESIDSLVGIEVDPFGVNLKNRGMITNIRMNKADKKRQVKQYLHATLHWLADHSMARPDELMDENLMIHVYTCLGRKSSAKERLVRILIARLTCDYYSMKKLRGLVADKKIIYRIEQLDIFSGDFQRQTEMLLTAIGQLTSHENNVEIQHPVFFETA